MSTDSEKIREPFGYWHEGTTEEESDFFLSSELGNVGCPSCVSLYADALLAAYDSMKAERDALAQRLEAAEKDAARYQLLRRGQHWSVIDGIGDTLRAEKLDAAIDAARALAGSGGSEG